LLHHGVYDLQADGDCGAFVVRDNAEKFKVENVEVGRAA